MINTNQIFSRNVCSPCVNYVQREQGCVVQVIMCIANQVHHQ